MDDWLLGLAQDCIRFVTKFFEPINASATHVYHSALELCPISSTVRKLYYNRCHGTTRLPRVVIGTTDSWDPTMLLSGEDDYRFCAWSPCGQFVAAQTDNAVEIRNQLTFELLTTLQPTETTHRLTGPLAYSPDGRSLACASVAAIVIWDIQTGGMAKEIQCGSKSISLVWSLDGSTIGTFGYHQETAIMHTYYVAGGTTLSAEALDSGDNLHLWTHGDSFRIMTAAPYRRDRATIDIEIFEVGASLTKIHSFRITVPERNFMQSPEIRCFSPATNCVSISAGRALRVLDIRDSNCALEEMGHFFSHRFSSDGSLFAASKENGIRIWKYTSGHYTLWREFWRQDWHKYSFQLSPTLSSILGHSKNLLNAWSLHDLPTTPKTHRQQYTGLSRSGNRIAIAHEFQRTITIADPQSQFPPQFIDTGVEIEGLVVTGNILLVVGSEKVVAWRLTEEGAVDGVAGDGRADQSDSIWTVLLPRLELWMFSVEGRLGMMKADGDVSTIYDTETGEVLDPVSETRHFSSPWHYFKEELHGWHYLHCHNMSRSGVHPEGGWQTSYRTLQEGWIKDPEGRCRLWVPADWRSSWDCADWLQDITTQFSIIGGKPVIVKF